MRIKFIAGVTLFFVVVAGVLTLVLIGPSLFAGASSASAGTNGATSTTVQGNVSAPNNDIVRENAQPGTYGWMIPAGKEATIQIQAYANSTYVLPGKSLKLYVSTEDKGTAYTISFYRLGWYAGFGGRLMASTNQLAGQAQGFYDASSRRLVNCTSCIVDTTTGMVDANWQPSYTLNIPSDWTTGIYLAKLIDAKGMQTYVPFDVLKQNSTSSYLAVTPDTTYAAYNDWGGASLYETDKTVNGSIIGEADTTAKGTKVSLNRPYVQEAGSSQVLVYEVQAVRWMERQGYDVSYISNINLQNVPGQLLNHKAYISLGHDEYWTKEMRDGVENARNSGVGLVFMGADAAYWQMRFEPDHAGVPNRIVVCYKVQTVHGATDLARDPLYNKDNTHLTAQWRDPVLARPENALIGIMYSDLTHKRLGYAWKVDQNASSPLMDGTGLQIGQSYGCGLVGYEWDRVYNNGQTPATLHVIATSSVVNDTGQADTSNTAYYIAPSGAMVFASGSIYWATALDNYRLHTDPACPGTNRAVAEIQIFMSHVMDEVIVHHTING